MITIKNPLCLSLKFHGIEGITTRAGVIIGWPDSLPPLTQEDVDGWELEYETVEIPKIQARKELEGTDQDLARILEDMLEALKTNHDIDLEAELPQKSKDKLKNRREAREKLK